MEIVLVVGDSDQGKSSLVRCLSGKSRDLHDHPNMKNIITLELRQSNLNEGVLVLISSLNEGSRYQNPGSKQYKNSNGTAAIHPLDLGDFFNDYQQLLIQQNFQAPSKAILCVSSSVNTPGWTDTDYYNVLANPNSAQRQPLHTVTHTVLIDQQPAANNWPNQIPVNGPPTAVNRVAADARRNLPIV